MARISKKKILLDIDIFLQENMINGVLEKIQTNIKNNHSTRDDDWLYIWQDYHLLGELLQKMSKYDKQSGVYKN